jgi:hypothetical protein
LRKLFGSGAVVLGVTAACGARTGLHAHGGSLQCVALDAQAEHSRLVVFVMLDTSGSMTFETADGESKAKAVSDALSEFFRDSASAGIGVGEAFFPIHRLDIPDRCRSDADCGGVTDACSLSGGLCIPSQETTCVTDADCQGTSDPTDKCYQVGVCADDLQTLCALGSSTTKICHAGAACVELGNCLDWASCNADDYAKLVVDVGTLPAARGQLLLGLETRVPKGTTPTLPALQGALSTGGAWQDAHPSDKAIVLFATDGLPTTCNPGSPPAFPEGSQGILNVVNAAKKGVAGGVQTFVVGVFAPDEEHKAQAALDRIAQGGGTKQAFIATTDSHVSAELIAAFDDIRRRAGACEYSIPWPKPGGIDPSTLTVAAGGAPVPRVASATACDSTGGFYFDRAPAPGAPPHRVILCPATCGANPPSTLHMEGSCRAVP